MSGTISRLAATSLLDPNQVNRGRFGCFTLPHIGGDEGNGQTGRGLDREGRGDMQRSADWLQMDDRPLLSCRPAMRGIGKTEAE